LNNSLKQFNWPGPELQPETWPQYIQEKTEFINWKAAEADAAPFLERSEDAAFINKGVIERLLR
jgi:hypothetical protein